MTKPIEVVVGAARERRGAARLGHRRRPLGVGERDEAEHQARRGEDDRCEAERGGSDDPERDVDRGADLAVGDREERGRVEDALEAPDLARHLVPLPVMRPRSWRARGKPG